MSPARLRQNLADHRTRGLTWGVLLGTVLALTGVALFVVIIITLASGVEATGATQIAAAGFTAAGIVVTTMFSIALGRAQRPD